MNRDTIAKLEAAHGEDAKWVRMLRMVDESPYDFYEIFHDAYYCSEDSLPFLAELAGMVETLKPPTTLAGDQNLSAPMVVLGDLRVEGSLRTSSVLVVLGDLEARIIRDCGPDSQVLVQGNVRAELIWTDGEFHSNGDIEASALIYGSYNDNVLVGNTIKAPVVVQDDHAMEGDITATHHIAYESQAPLKEVFIEGAFDDERGKLDYGVLCDAILAGKDVFR